MRRVLVVEPDTDARRALQHLLIEEGCEVAAAADGRAALLDLEGHGPDAVFCAVRELASLSKLASLTVATVPRAEFREGLSAVERGAAVDCLVLPAEREDVALALGRAAR